MKQFRSFMREVGAESKVQLSEASLKFELDSEARLPAGATFMMVNPDSPLMKIIKNPKKLKTIETYGLKHEVRLTSPEAQWGEKNSWTGKFYATYWTGKQDKKEMIYIGHHKSYKEMISKTEKAIKKYTKGKWDLRKAPTEEELLKGDVKKRHNNSAN